jgi:hypothetical protein
MISPIEPQTVSRPVDQLTPQRIAQITAEITSRFHLDPAGAEQVKFTNNVVLLLPAARAVLRMAGSATIRARVPAVIAAAHWYAGHDIPAVRLWPDVQHPISVGEHLITLWQQIPTGGPEPAPADLARILHAIHAVPDPHPAGIPDWQIIKGIKQRLQNANGIDPDTLAFLTAEAAQIEKSLTQLPAIEPLIPAGLVHGDAHLGNVIPSPDGPVICDFDSTSVGPREWDFVPAAVGSLCFNYPQDVHAGIVQTYGLDVTTWPGFPILRRLREFQLVTSVLPALQANPALRTQWQHRLNTYRNHDDQTPWTPYADAAN